MNEIYGALGRVSFSETVCVEQENGVKVGEAQALFKRGMIFFADNSLNIVPKFVVIRRTGFGHTQRFDLVSQVKIDNIYGFTVKINGFIARHTIEL